MQIKVCDYSHYNYKKEYWQNIDRRYEQLIETRTLQKLLKLIPNVNTLMDLGCGFGRLFPCYEHKAENFILADYCKDLLKEARETIKSNKHILFLNANAYELPLVDQEVDLIISIRTLHHFIQPQDLIKEVSRVLKTNGYFIFEIPNKRNLKQILKFCIKKSKTNPFSEDIYFLNEVFVNFHPKLIKRYLAENGLIIKKSLNTSFFRISLFKKIVPLPVLVMLDAACQKLFSFLNLSPSIYLLCQKTGV